MQKLLLAALALVTLALPVHAAAEFSVLGDNERFVIRHYIYVPLFQSWCINLSGGNASWGGCIPEYAIPPENLRQLRSKAGINPDTPVFKP